MIYINLSYVTYRFSYCIPVDFSDARNGYSSVEGRTYVAGAQIICSRTVGIVHIILSHLNSKTALHEIVFCHM